MHIQNRPAGGGYDQHHMARSVRASLDRPVVLLGLMGSGKSRLGRMLARALDVTFYDCDAELEQSAGRRAHEIFEQIGAEAFEQAENRILQRLVSQNDMAVIATGGGVSMPPDLLETVFTKAVTIWVRADLDLMVARTTRGLPRPHLSGHDPRPILEGMMARYHPLYARADVIVDSHDGPAAEVLHQTLYALNARISKVAAG